MQFRSSSHRYNIETGRYGGNKNAQTSRVCWNCSTNDKEALELLCELPTIKPIIEDEWHILTDCSLYDDIRSKLKHNTKSVLDDGSDLRTLFKDPTTTRDLARFLRRCHDRRFPKETEQSITQNWVIRVTEQGNYHLIKPSHHINCKLVGDSNCS